MNRSVYDAARTLPSAALTADRTAFFGSILRTLNHLVNDLDSLGAQRPMLDQVILDWSAAVSEDDLDHTLHYVSSRRVTNKNYFSLVMHS